MCATCGCGGDDVRVTLVGAGTETHQHAHDHPHDHPHEHPHSQAHDSAAGIRTHTLELEEAVLARNDDLAAHNRAWLDERGVTVVNLMSSPGSGKTTLLEKTIAGSTRPVSVIEGDQETLYDAQRIRAAGARAVQVNTGSGCHLDAVMVRRALDELAPEHGSLVVVENVGNLVCPALFDLGETRRVVVCSVTEGDDKPLKYPHMFGSADLVVLNKTDLLPYVDFDVERFESDLRKLQAGIEIMPVSARTGAGLDDWQEWLTNV